MYEVQPLVIDNGSYNLKAGFGGDDRPRAIFPAVVGRRPNKNSTMIGMGDCVPLIADQALSMRNVLDLLYPVERGIVTYWDIMEELWDYTFRRELRTDSNEHSILLTEPLLNPKLNREKMTQIMFEKFEVPEMYVTNTAVLSLLAMNRDTGIVLDSGDGVTTITPVYEGHAVQHGIVRLDLAGRDLTDYLMKLLSDRGLPFKTTTEREIVRDIKEKLCYVALDYEQEIVTATNTNDVMRQAENFQGLEPHEINSERFRCPEALFQPSLLGLETAGVHEHINNAILKCDNTLHSTLYNNVVLSGGSTMFPGMMERLQKELTVLAPGKAVKVVGSPIRHFSAWLGGSLMTSMYMRDRWITKQEYEENGAKIVHRKCI